MNTTLASSPGVPKDTIHKILNEDFVVPKKSARWVTKFLSHISAVVGDWFTAVAFQCLENPLYLLDLFLAYFFLLSHMKEALAEQKLTTNSLKSDWVGVTATAAKEAYVAEVCNPYECCLMWIQLGGNHAKKHYKTLVPLKCLLFVLFSMSRFRPNTPRI